MARDGRTKWMQGLWADPEFAATQLANLRRGREMRWRSNAGEPNVAVDRSRSLGGRAGTQVVDATGNGSSAPIPLVVAIVGCAVVLTAIGVYLRSTSQTSPTQATDTYAAPTVGPWEGYP
jgi:hypothetical protein